MENLAIEDLSFTYAGAEEPVLRGVNLRLREGEFALLTGGTGCGKTTLLTLIKRELAPRGELRGRILFCGRETGTFSDREAAESVGFVFQRPEQQIVTDRVWHELAFGLENLGVPETEMRRRVAETAQFFGLEEYMDARTDRLSGGQKQLLNLAAVTAAEPKLLLLDEPAARLDPISARNFFSMLERLHRETGMTILMAEHRLEDVLDRADRLILMEAGRIAAEGEPRRICGETRPSGAAEGALPAAARIWRGTGKRGECPLNAGEGRTWLISGLKELSADNPETARRDSGVFPDSGAGGKNAALPERSGAGGKTAGRKERRPEENEAPEEALRFREVRFRFSRDGKDVLRSAGFSVRKGEIFALLGGNGSGKTTLLRAAAGLIQPYAGEIRLFGKKLKEYRNGTLRYGGTAMLPQDVQTLFLRGSVREELKDSGIGPEELPFDLSGLMDRHPYDLSGGEQQLLGLAKVLAAKPKMLLLDEPTGGLDAAWRRRIRELLRELRRSGMTLLLVTHDAEFAAETADRCGLLFRGRVEAAAEPHAFFAGSGYYGTPVSRMTKGLIPGCVMVKEAVSFLREAGGAGSADGETAFPARTGSVPEKEAAP